MVDFQPWTPRKIPVCATGAHSELVTPVTKRLQSTHFHVDRARHHWNWTWIYRVLPNLTEKFRGAIVGSMRMTNHHRTLCSKPRLGGVMCKICYGGCDVDWNKIKAKRGHPIPTEESLSDVFVQIRGADNVSRSDYDPCLR
ncbi:hypothetical protein TNCV_243811 [Trichonephila clavipes]|uniref:Uncharacterized protein n=1 Tax=Trichonephila clavipes TaxID=2585209 RepID=A0A8X6RPU1_TRICX|nr:hypothetical protein TNCV_243811 [Trichonephila clavipes]